MAAEKMNTEQVALGDSSLPTIFSMIAPLDPVFPVVGDAGEAAWGAMVWYPPCPHTQQEVLLLSALPTAPGLGSAGSASAAQLQPAGEGKPTSSKAKPRFLPTPDLCRDYLGGLFSGWLPPTPDFPIPQGDDSHAGGGLVLLPPSPAWR